MYYFEISKQNLNVLYIKTIFKMKSSLILANNEKFKQIKLIIKYITYSKKIS